MSSVMPRPPAVSMLNTATANSLKVTSCALPFVDGKQKVQTESIASTSEAQVSLGDMLG